MTLLEKLSKARLDIQNAGIKKTGYNKIGFNYYELHDILPKINELADEYKFICTVSFNSEAKLTIIDIEKPEDTISFTSPMASAKLQGAHDVQNMGAVQTYMRRYLYLLAFEITENDQFDGSSGNEKNR